MVNTTSTHNPGGVSPEVNSWRSLGSMDIFGENLRSAGLEHAETKTMEARRVSTNSIVIAMIPQNIEDITHGLKPHEETQVLSHYRAMLASLFPGWTIGDQVNSSWATWGKRGELANRFTYSIHPPQGGGALPSKKTLETFMAAFPWWKGDLAVIMNAIEQSGPVSKNVPPEPEISVDGLKAEAEEVLRKFRTGERLDVVYARDPKAFKNRADLNPNGEEAVYYAALKIQEALHPKTGGSPTASGMSAHRISKEQWDSFVQKYGALNEDQRRKMSLGILAEMILLTEKNVDQIHEKEDYWLWRPNVAKWGGRVLWSAATAVPAAMIVAGGHLPAAAVALSSAVGCFFSAAWNYYAYERLSDFPMHVAKAAVDPYPVLAALRVVKKSLQRWGVARFVTERDADEMEGTGTDRSNAPCRSTVQLYSQQELNRKLASISDPDKRKAEEERLLLEIAKTERLEPFDIMFDSRFGERFSDRDDRILFRNRAVYEESAVEAEIARPFQWRILHNSTVSFGFKYQGISDLIRQVEGTALRWQRLTPPEKAQAKLGIQNEISGMSAHNLAFGLLQRKNNITFLCAAAAPFVATIASWVLSW